MKHMRTLLLRGLEQWYRWSVPPAPSTDAPLAARILARRQRTISISLLLGCFIGICSFILGFFVPNPIAPFTATLAALIPILGILLNRRGLSILAGLLPIICGELLYCITLGMNPGGLHPINLAELDTFAGYTLAASLLLPTWYVFPIAVGNIGIVCAMLLLLPKTPEVQHLIASEPAVFGVPIILQMAVAGLSFYGGYNCLQALHEADRADEIQHLYREQAQAALTDALTGLPNHRAVMEQLSRELERAQRSHHPFSLLFFDADHFKHVNDLYGHPTGDVVLDQIGKRASSVLRSGDTLGRFGGEEFVILLPAADTREAGHIAERLRAAVAAEPVATSEVQGGIALTVSIGLSTYPADGSTEKTLLSQADEAMYTAKRLGRNQICTAEEARRMGEHLGLREPAILAAQTPELVLLASYLISSISQSRQCWQIGNCPQHQEGESICLCARILAIAEVYHTLLRQNQPDLSLEFTTLDPHVPGG